MAYFYKNLFLFSIVSQKFWGNKPHNCFRSLHGNSYGLNAPHECGNFWYRWLPDDKHFIDFNEISYDSKEEIDTIVTAITNRFNKPLVFKNLNAGQRLRLIKEIFPDSIFIYIKRDPVYTSQSILQSRERIHNDRTKWWSIMPKEYNELQKLDYHEQIVKQVYFLQKQIEQDLNYFNDHNYITVWYNKFCKNPRKYINLIYRKLLQKNGYNVDYISYKIKNDLKSRNTRKVDIHTFKKLESIVNKLEW